LDKAKLKFIAKIDSLDIQGVDKLFYHIKSTQELIPGTTDIIKTLHKNKYQLFALTDNIKEIVHHLENRYDFWQYFTNTTVSANIGLMKPGKEIFDYTLQTNKLLPQETVFIDDHLPNVETANLLGLHTILFSDSKSCAQELEHLGVNINN
jgi:putative hydrolase of the HAD superfamily